MALPNGKHLWISASNSGGSGRLNFDILKICDVSIVYSYIVNWIFFTKVKKKGIF